VAVVALLAIVAAVVFLGGDDQKSPDEFAQDACEAVRDDAEELSAATGDLEELFSGAPTNETLDEGANAFRRMADAIDGIADGIDGAGTPDVEDGEAAVDEVVTFMHDYATDVRGAADLMEDTDADDQAQLEELFTELESVGAGGNPDFEFENSELEAAMDDNEACQAIDDALS
jgi:hypothetical protein